MAIAATATTTLAPDASENSATRQAEQLADWLGGEWALFSLSGEPLNAWAERNDLLWSPLAAGCVERSKPHFVAEAGSVLLLAVPLLRSAEFSGGVAMSPVVTGDISPAEVGAAARLLGMESHSAMTWLAEQPRWDPATILRMADAWRANQSDRRRMEQLETEVESLSQSLANTYEEISLLYGLTQKLRISSTDEELGRLALEWLADCLPVEGLAILLLPVAEERDVYKSRGEPVLLTQGTLPCVELEFAAWMRTTGLGAHTAPLVLNDLERRRDCPAGVHQVMVAPLAEGDNLFGWAAAVNHLHGAEFGTVEASLLQSVGAILGIHAGNRNLYRKQSEFLAGVVRAFTSAIDAKDPYTCGHSDRVARIAVRLAQQIEFDRLPLNMLYMAGLLHDIGKIGIDDNVLRKPGPLTDEEYEHIKRHPELGHRILADIRPLAQALPVVLHHHEQWDGGGYPHGLAGEEIPLEARLVAVADAYDAMTSDRPYRRGMPHEKVERIFRAGAGRQWDAEIIEAFFAASRDIQELCRRERANLSLDVQQWDCDCFRPSEAAAESCPQ